MALTIYDLMAAFSLGMACGLWVGACRRRPWPPPQRVYDANQTFTIIGGLY